MSGNLEKTLKNNKHPRGLYVLFFTEMWERFGFYLMIGIFSLYMLDNRKGGMGFTDSEQSDVYGTYIGLVYLTPFIGGLLADRILGYRRSILIGGLLMAAGYFGLAIPGNDLNIFYISLLLIILGNGFFKPNISTLVGNLYNDESIKHKKDAGYNIFYMGINIGAFLCNFVAAFLRNKYGWGSAFAAAGTGMLLSVIIFLYGTRHIIHADVLKPKNPEDLSIGKIMSYVLLPVFVFGLLGWMIPGNLFGTDANDAFLFGCIPIVGFYLTLLFKANAEDKKPIGALLSVYFAVIVFWAVFHQNGDALTKWADDFSNRKTPELVEGVMKDLYLSKEATLDTTLLIDGRTAFDTKYHALKKEYKELKGAKDTTGLSAKKHELDQLEGQKYFPNLAKDKRPEHGENLLLVSTELYQSINPFWVIFLTPVVIGLFSLLRRKGWEPSTPAKIAIGMLITAVSALVMVAAVESTQIESEKSSSFWLFASYAVITFGELCLSPMGLSLVSKLSPTRLTSLMMGGWFLSTSIGNKFAGILSSNFESGDKTNFFLLNSLYCFCAFLLLFFMLKWLRKVMREKGIN